MRPFRDALDAALDEVRDLLIEKNASYGDSARRPLGCFARTSPLEQIDVRIDDKLSRIMRGSEYKNEDTMLDLLGYLVLRRIVQKDQE